jgi:hypothetical protein
MEETLCTNPAIYRYTWPGQNEKRVCLEHAMKLIGVARAIEFPLQIIQLTLEEIIEDSQCHQKIR